MTLIMANEIAKKCGQEKNLVIYDLAIAKMAMQIQEKEKPKFENIFINLGAFHYNENSPLVREFRRGAFGIRRTNAKFARSPVDLTLEQTINADASNQFTDNLAVDSISVRWAECPSFTITVLELKY